MTTGQLVFCSGAGLLVLTMITAIIFIVKKPKYKPEQAVYGDAARNVTQQLRNGYPTERVTIRRESKPAVGPNMAFSNIETEKLVGSQTEQDQQMGEFPEETEVLDTEDM